MLNIFKKNIKHTQKIVALVLIVTLYVLPFEIFAEPEKPINTSPADTATNISLTPTLESSSYENIIPVESDISALSPNMWIDFSDASTVTTVSGKVSQVTDKSGNGRTFTQNTGVKRPIYQSAVQNSLNVARFDGVEEVLQLSSNTMFRNIGGASLYIILKPESGGAAGDIYFSSGNGLSTNRIYLLYSHNLFKFSMAGRRLDSDSFQNVIQTGTTSPGSFMMISNVYDWSNASIFTYKDRNLIGTSTSFQTAGNTSNTNANLTRIGANLSNDGFWFGDIGEIIVFNSVHDADTKDTVEQYLNNKWAIFAEETHLASQWQVTDTSGDYSSPVYDSGEDAANLESITIPSSTLSGLTTYYWRVKYKDEDNVWSDWSDETSFTTETDIVGSLSVDIVDAGGTTVGSPSAQMDSQTFSFSDQTSTGTFGTSSQKIRVDNGTGTATWTLSLAADIGATAIWDGTSADYDFNDPTASAADGGDTDSLGGQMTIDPTTITITPEGGCTATNVSGGSSSAFSEGVTDSATLASASSGADTDCYWDLTDISVSQTIPAEQPADDYAIDMTLSIIAS